MQTTNNQINTAINKANNQPNIPDQISLFGSAPTADKVVSVQNPPVPSRSTEVLPTRDNGYCGNKPYGGIWTSSYTPNASDGYRSDWERALCINPLVTHPAGASAPNLPGWILRAKNGVKILTIDSLAKAIAFTGKYHLEYFKIPKAFMSQNEQIKWVFTTLITNWRKACVDYDCIHLTEAAHSEVVRYKVEQNGQTAFHTWDCESTLWAKWCFGDVDVSSDCVMAKLGLAHYTVNSGHLTYSRGVPSWVIDLLRPLVAVGGPIPNCPLFTVSLTYFAGGSVFNILKRDVIVASCVVAFSADGEKEAWLRTEELNQQAVSSPVQYFGINPCPTMPKRSPWLSVVLWPALSSVSQEEIARFGDFEKCMAWTILAERA